MSPDYFKKTVRKTSDALRSRLWEPVPAEITKKWYVTNIVERPFESFAVDFSDGRISKSMREYNSTLHCEYLIKCPYKTIVEPVYGWALIQAGKYLSESLPYKYYTRPPSVSNYIDLKNSKKIKSKYKEIISLRDIGEGNYYHCYNDLLFKIAFLDRLNVDRNIPFVISETLYNMRFFQDILLRSNLNNRKWIVQKDEYVVSDSAYFCKSMTLRKEHLNAVLDMLRVPDPETQQERKVFINRSFDSARTIANIDEITVILNRYGFEIVELENSSLDDQINLFSSVRYLVGIHGAGLTNLIFRRSGKLSVLEIFPPNNIPPHYYWISRTLGYEYDAIAGYFLSKNDETFDITKKISFKIDPIDFQAKIKKLLNSK